MLRVDVKAPPEKGRANRETVKFLHKAMKKKVRIISGFRGREKMVEVG